MFIIEDPYYLKNKDWYYYDPRERRLRLTDKATVKAINSFIDANSRYNYGLCFLPNAVEIVKDWAKQDIEDFKKNKFRYTIEEVEFCEAKYTRPTLIAVDGKNLDFED